MPEKSNLGGGILSSLSGTNWYSGSWTIRAAILRAAQDYGPQCTTKELNSRLSLRKSSLSYHLKALTMAGLIERDPGGWVATWSITQAGLKFLAEVRKRLPSRGLISLENARFSYKILRDSTLEVDWKKVPMTNWTQFIGKVGRTTVLKQGRTVTIIVRKTLGTNPSDLVLEARDLADEVAEGLETQLSGLQLVRRPAFLGYGPHKAHFEVGGDPVAESISGFMTVRGAAGSTGDTSAPHYKGSVGFFDPRKVDAYMRAITNLPLEIDMYRSEIRGELSEVETAVDRIENKLDQIITQKHSTEEWVGQQSLNEPMGLGPRRLGFNLLYPLSSVPVPQFGMFQSVGPTPPGVFGLDGGWARPTNPGVPTSTISFPPVSIDDLRAKGRIFFVK